MSMRDWYVTWPLVVSFIAAVMLLIVTLLEDGGRQRRLAFVLVR